MDKREVLAEGDLVMCHDAHITRPFVEQKIKAYVAKYGKKPVQVRVRSKAFIGDEVDGVEIVESRTLAYPTYAMLVKGFGRGEKEILAQL